ncbi:OB-fold domain-containing protein [Haliea sp. E1-2-M8]|uniref:Zn-ribbon domain-containing OB-fold protein n=1 Tax=Haliea sp. E1-2-M8 TaxID=3064706 RepID=UPI0027186D11|nr:OB-fold domain-containing protein [Haliea sp. E1-2-M8]MDO8864011.1 OB-fold domain-containing protein [Haliea sp. E1-2-M8]
MNDVKSSENLLPVVGFLKIPKDGQPYLEGARCDECEAVYTKPQTHCAQCLSPNSLRPYKLGCTGKLYTYSIVCRSFPGIEVPFISAYVDLDGGGALKGNLIDVEATPDAIRFGMPVNIIFDEALGRKDRKGNSYLSYFFAPA